MDKRDPEAKCIENLLFFVPSLIEMLLLLTVLAIILYSAFSYCYSASHPRQKDPEEIQICESYQYSTLIKKGV